MERSEADSNTKTCLEGPYFKPEEDCTEGTSYVKLETNTSWQVIVDLVSIDLMVSQWLSEDGS